MPAWHQIMHGSQLRDKIRVNCTPFNILTCENVDCQTPRTRMKTLPNSCSCRGVALNLNTPRPTSARNRRLREIFFILPRNYTSKSKSNNSVCIAEVHGHDMAWWHAINLCLHCYNLQLHLLHLYFSGRFVDEGSRLLSVLSPKSRPYFEPTWRNELCADRQAWRELLPMGFLNVYLFGLHLIPSCHF